MANDGYVCHWWPCCGGETSDCHGNSGTFCTSFSILLPQWFRKLALDLGKWTAVDSFSLSLPEMWSLPWTPWNRVQKLQLMCNIFCGNFLLLFKCSLYLRAAYRKCAQPAKPVKVVWHMYSESATLPMLQFFSKVNKHWGAQSIWLAK